MYKPVSRIFFAILLTSITFITFTTAIHAAEEFKTSYDALYFVKDNGEVKVTQNVTIENLTSQYFVSQYKFTIGSEEPKNITAWDQTGSLTPKIKREEGETIITFKLRSRVVGKGNKLKFGISYDFPKLATKNGLIWELNLLKISNLKKISSYALTISIPESFGPALFYFPTPTIQREEKDRKIITYKKSSLLLGAPRLAFGKFQLYQLTLTYHLENPSISLGYTEVAIPPDIHGYQQIVQTSLLPAASSIRVDNDGNYLARYNLGPFEKKEVVWEGLIALFYPQRNFSQEKASVLPQDLVEKYTIQQKYWETEAIEIEAQAARLTDPKLSVVKNLQNIYDFVTSKLSYDYEKLEAGELVRLGALATLAQKDDAICMEYTDLFIALSRASGIPVREINGYAYTIDDTNRPLSLRIQGGDVLHAWSQAYIPQSGWTMIDPTWGSTSGSNYFTTFDLSHLTFVVKGESSEYPLPAGSYKTDQSQKDVEVSFTSETSSLNEKPQLDIQIDYPTFAISPFPVNTTIKIKNTSKVSAFGVTLSVQSTLLSIEQSELDLGTIPPGATISKEITLTPESALTHGEEQLHVIVKAKDFEGNELSSEGNKTKTVRPLYFPFGLQELGIITLTLFTIIFGRRLLLTRLAK